MRPPAAARVVPFRGIHGAVRDSDIRLALRRLLLAPRRQNNRGEEAEAASAVALFQSPEFEEWLSGGVMAHHGSKSEAEPLPGRGGTKGADPGGAECLG